MSVSLLACYSLALRSVDFGTEDNEALFIDTEDGWYNVTADNISDVAGAPWFRAFPHHKRRQDPLRSPRRRGGKTNTWFIDSLSASLCRA